jgi:hypothetical protein
VEGSDRDLIQGTSLEGIEKTTKTSGDPTSGPGFEPGTSRIRSISVATQPLHSVIKYRIRTSQLMVATGIM